MRVENLVLTAVLLINISNLSSPAFAETFFKLRNNSDDTVNTIVYERMNPAIVSIECDTKDGVSSGTGCIIREDGVILTSSHVIEDSRNIEITTANGAVYNASVISISGKDNDLAFLKINPKSKLPTVLLGDSAKIKTGQKVLAIGNPFGLNGTLTTGIISRIDYTRNKIQTDAAINPGNSGGPIINTRGEVIGISQSIFNPDNNKSNIGIGFAVPINEAKKIMTVSKI